MIVALATMIVGVLGAVAQAELKRILSFTLVSHIGYMVFGLAIATPASIGATIYYMVHHIVVQTTLFLAVGLIERRAGSTSILRVKGLMRAAPVIAVLYFIPAVNLGGLPPFSGFIGKFALFEAAAEVGTPDHDGAHRRRHRDEPPHPVRAHARLEPRVLARGGRLGRDRGAHLVPRRVTGRRRRDRAARHPADHDGGDRRDGRRSPSR